MVHSLGRASLTLGCLLVLNDNTVYFLFNLEMHKESAGK